MDWLYPKKRGPQWKQGWRGQAMASISMPPSPLLAIFAIVIFLLSISQTRNYREQLENARISFHIFLFFVPIFLIFLLMIKPPGLFSSTEGGWLSYFNFWGPRRRQQEYYYSSMQRNICGGGFPWGVAVLLVALLVLVSYQSSFQSKWFQGLRRSDYY